MSLQNYTIPGVKSTRTNFVTALLDAGHMPLPAIDKVPSFYRDDGTVTKIAVKQYPPSRQQILQWFAGPHAYQLGLYAQPVVVQGHLRAPRFMDFDDATIFDEYLACAAARGYASILERCAVARSPHGGRIAFLSSYADRLKVKLATRPGDNKHPDTLVELVNFLLIPPTSGYETVSGDFTALPVLTIAEEDALLTAAKHFHVPDTRPPSDTRRQPTSPRPQGTTPQETESAHARSSMLGSQGEGRKNREPSTSAHDTAHPQYGRAVQRHFTREDSVRRMLPALGFAANLPLGTTVTCPLHPPDNTPSLTFVGPHGERTQYGFVCHHEGEAPCFYSMTHLFYFQVTGKVRHRLPPNTFLVYGARLLRRAGIAVCLALGQTTLPHDAPTAAKRAYQVVCDLLQCRSATRDVTEGTLLGWEFVEAWSGRQLDRNTWTRGFRWLLQRRFLIKTGVFWHEARQRWCTLFGLGSRKIRLMGVGKPTPIAQGAILAAVEPDRQTLLQERLAAALAPPERHPEACAVCRVIARRTREGACANCLRAGATDWIQDYARAAPATG